MPTGAGRNYTGRGIIDEEEGSSQEVHVLLSHVLPFVYSFVSNVIFTLQRSALIVVVLGYIKSPHQQKGCSL